MVPHEAQGQQIHRQIAEKTHFILFLNVPQPKRPRQPFSHPCSAPEHSTIMFSQGECRRHMKISPPTLTGRLMSHSIGRLTCWPAVVALPEHVEEAVGQNSHEQPHLLRCESVATGLAQRTVFSRSSIRFSTSPRPLYTLTTFSGRELKASVAACSN